MCIAYVHTHTNCIVVCVCVGIPVCVWALHKVRKKHYTYSYSENITNNMNNKIDLLYVLRQYICTHKIMFICSGIYVYTYMHILYITFYFFRTVMFYV